MNKLLTIYFFLCCGVLQAQTTTMNDNVVFSTANQSMWGTGLGFSLDKNIPLIPQTNFGGPPATYGGVTNISPFGDFGFEMEAGMWGSFGSKFYIKDVTGGKIDIDYPIQTIITYPSINTINKGEWITISTNYNVTNGWALKTYFPNTGSMGIDFNFNLGVKFKPKLCAFTCFTPFDLSVNGGVNFDLFKLSANEIIYPATSSTPCFGYCTSTTSCVTGAPCFPVLVKQNLLPLNYPANNLGISGYIDLPFVNTSDNLLPNKCLTANGFYRYFDINLDVLQFMSNYIPPPAGPIIGNLNNSFSAGPFFINYNLLSANFNVNNTTHQNFSFCPTIKSNFHFVSSVFYEEVTPAGSVVAAGQAQDITITTGNNLRIKYPCNREFIDVDVDYDLKNTFSNHTYDVIGVNFILQSMDFNIGMNSITVFQGFCLDPCGGLFGGCSFCIPTISFPGFSFGTGGPLINYTLPIASIPYDWYNGSWELGGFTNQPGGAFTLDAMPYLAQSISTPVDCFGDNTGTMQVNVTNGVPPFNYIWNDGTIISSSNQTETYSNLVAGPASVIVEDANGCQAITTQLITEPIEPLQIYNVQIKQVDCSGNSTGEISFDVLGGNPPYSFAWSPLVSNSNTATNLPAGSYSVNITDSKGCSITENFVITEPSPISAYAAINKHVNCKGGTDGSASIFPSGGSYPYSYYWSTGDNIQTVTNLPAGNHSCIVTDINGCSITVPVLISEPAQNLQLTISSTPLTCNNNQSGLIDLTVAGGTMPYAFNWYNSSYQLLSQHVEDPTGLAADTYLVNVTDNNGCFDTISVIVTQPDSLILQNVQITDVLCYGNNTGSIDVNLVGGTLPYTYNWSNGVNTEDVFNLLANTYTLNVSDFNGCLLTDTFEVIQPDTAIYASSINVDVLCFGDATGSINLNVNGGTPPYTYLWSTGSASEDLSNLAAGNYTVTITDAHNCQLIYNTTIYEPSNPLNTINTVTPVSCFNASDGAIQTQTTGGTLPYYYQWNNSSAIILADTTANPQNLIADTYTVLVTDGNQCEFTATAIVTQPDSLIISSSQVDVLCTNNNTGSIDITVNGGTLPYTYNWSNGQNTQDLSNLLAGTYILNVVDFNNCTATKTIEITEPEKALELVLTKKDVLCKGEATGLASVSITGGVAPYTSTWSNGDQNLTTDSLLAGIYTVTILDQNNCIANSGVIINEPTTHVTFSTVVTDASCFNALDGVIQILPNGGITPYQIIFGDTLLNSYNNQSNSYVLSGLHQGLYYARVIDDNGCEFDTLITVNQPDSLMVTGEVTDALCFGSQDGMVDLIVTGGTLPYSYVWSDSSTFEDLINVYAGWYDVIVTDSQNCMTPAFFFIDQPDEILIEGFITETTCRDNEDGSITVVVEGGIPGYDYLWSNNEITETIYDLAPGTYTIQVLDQHNCVKTDTFVINQSIIDCIDAPNSFTPDGDGINDTWVLDNVNNYPDATVQIYNKWGNLLYETTNGNYTPWNGYYNGKRLPAATYYYIINLNNGDAPYTGPLTIVINE